MELEYCPFCGCDEGSDNIDDIPRLVWDDVDQTTVTVQCGHCRATGGRFSLEPEYLDTYDGPDDRVTKEEIVQMAIDNWNDESLRLNPISRRIKGFFVQTRYDIEQRIDNFFDR